MSMRLNALFFMIWKQRLMQKLLGKRLPVRMSWEQTPARFTDMVAFLNWFDATQSVEDCMRKAKIDWEHRFKVFPYFASLPRRRAVEIGFGGGRLLCQASKDFELVFGIDIHSAFAMTRKLLESQGCRNVELLHRDEIVRIADDSIDFVYSFIVFQHFDTMDEVDYYLNHMERILAPHGIAHIYFGKKSGDGAQIVSDKNFQLRDCSLFMAPALMRERVERQFEVLGLENSLPRDSVTKSGESAQAMIIFRKRLAADAGPIVNL